MLPMRGAHFTHCSLFGAAGRNLFDVLSCCLADLCFEFDGVNAKDSMLIRVVRLRVLP